METIFVFVAPLGGHLSSISGPGGAKLTILEAGLRVSRMGPTSEIQAETGKLRAWKPIY